MKISTKHIWINIVSLTAGAITPLAFAPFNLYLIAPASIAILFSVWFKSRPVHAAFRGLLFGLGFYGIGVSWVYISIHRFGNISVPLSLLITALFITALSFFPAAQGYLLSKFFSKNRLLGLLLAYPASWFLFEWSHDWIFSGFPWLYLGYSQINSPLSGYGPIFGVYGISFMVALSAALITTIIFYKSKLRYFLLIFLLLIWALGSLFGKIQWTKPISKALKVSVIQGNIPQNLKWSAAALIPTMELYKKLTEKHWKSDIIIWPEASIPLPLPASQNYIDALSNEAKKHHTSLILGIPVQADFDRFYNAVIAVGAGHGQYFKKHLVPFGEYIPLKSLFGHFFNLFTIPIPNLAAGPKKKQMLYTNGILIAPYVCYEVAFAQLVRSDISKAQLLITVTNDSWFGRSIASYQHAQIGQIRSLETGHYMIFSSNNGVTAIINQHGFITKTIPRFETGVLTGKVYAMKGKTPWVILGIWPIFLLSLAFLIIAFCSGFMHKKE